MQTVERSNSVEVVQGGRFFGSFPNRGEADAYVRGYEAALRDAREIAKKEGEAMQLAIGRLGAR
jgi:hypothetical protein